MKFLNSMNFKKGFLGLLTKVLFFLLFPIYASASFIVEPSYNIYSGKFKSGDERGKLTGHVYGLNLGYLGEVFMAGITLETGKYSYDKNVTTESTSKFDGGGVGTFLGFHLWDRLKLWTGYLNSTLEPTSNKDIRYFGQHISYGLGIRLFDGLMLNLYEFKNQFTQIEDDTTGKTGGLDPKIKTYGTNLSLSYILIF